MHRLVATAFIDNKDNLPIINHKDENKKNNCVSNLEWCTYQYNSNYGNTQQRKVMSIDFKKVSDSKKIPILQYDLDGNFIKRWDSAKDCAIKLGLGNGLISKCCRGEVDIAYGFMWFIENGEILNKINPYGKDEKKVNQYNLEGKLIKTWRSISDAAKILKLDKSSISKCINGKLKKVGGYIWGKYEVIVDG